MTEPAPEDVTAALDQPAGTRPEPTAPAKGKRPPARKAEAALSSYFGEKAVGASAFVAAVRAAELKRFADDDLAGVHTLMEAYDPDGTRLLGLAGQVKLPPALNLWVWPVVQARLRAQLPGLFEPQVLEANAAFRKLLGEFGPQMSSDSAETRQRAKVSLLLGLAWFSRRSTFAPREALEELFGTLFKDGDEAERAVIRALAGGELKGLRQAAAVAGLGREAIREASARAERDHERRMAAEDALAAARKEIADLRAAVETLIDERNDLDARLAAAERRFEERQQHWGNDMAAKTARQKLMLGGTIAPLLDDAVSALAAEPIFPDIALERLREALAAIREAVR